MNTPQERRTQAEEEFNALEKKKGELTEELDQINKRQYELRGQYQVLTEQIDAEEKQAVSPSADTVDVDAALESKDKKK